MSIQRQLTNERMSQIVVHSGTVYLAGQVGDDMNAGIEQQTRETLANIERLLDLAGTDKTKLAVGDDLPERHRRRFRRHERGVGHSGCQKASPRPAPRLKPNCANRKSW